MQFSAKIFIIGINPYVLLPANILKEIFAQAGKDKGHIPVQLIINDQKFIQHLIKYAGKWRLYLNTPMRKIADATVGDIISIDIAYDVGVRITPMHPKLKSALSKNKIANDIFDSLPPSRKKEIMRYINNLKTAESVERNVKKAIDFLQGKERFIGRDNP
jgi:hypothetical protein